MRHFSGLVNTLTLKTENVWVPDVSRVRRNGTLTSNELHTCH